MKKLLLPRPGVTIKFNIDLDTFCAGMPVLRLVGASPSRCEPNAPFIAHGGRGSDEPHAAQANARIKRLKNPLRLTTLLLASTATCLGVNASPLAGGVVSTSKQEITAPVAGMTTPVWREPGPGAHLEVAGRFSAQGPDGSILLRVGDGASPHFSLAWDAAENTLQLIQPGSLPLHTPTENAPVPGAREMAWRVVLRPLAQPTRAVLHTFKQGKWQATQSFDLPPWQGAQQWIEEGGVVFAGVANAALNNFQVKAKVDGTLLLVR